jgi:hypothetical protein
MVPAVCQDLRPVQLTGLAVGLGALLGFLTARVVLVGSGVSLVPWTLAGLALGLCCRTAARACLAGSVYGFTLAYVFMVTGYDGASPLHTRLIPFVVFGLVGAVCGMALTLVGRLFVRAGRR